MRNNPHNISSYVCDFELYMTYMYVLCKKVKSVK